MEFTRYKTFKVSLSRDFLIPFFHDTNPVGPRYSDAEELSEMVSILPRYLQLQKLSGHWHREVLYDTGTADQEFLDVTSKLILKG